jgi:uncharacterized protein involved in exopolysaccharide biosynthesis
MENSDKHAYQNDEVTLKEIIVTVQTYLGEVWRRKFLILFVTGLCAFAFLLVAFLTKPTFPGVVTFMVTEEDQSGGGLSGILGQFGFGGSSEHNLDKILELSKSRRIAQNVVFDTITIAGKADLLANHTIEYLESQEEWGQQNILYKLLYGSDPLLLKGFRFENGDVETFTPLENKALKILHIKIAGTPDGAKQGLVSTEYSEDSGIMQLIANTKRPELSALLSTKLYTELSRYYIEKATEKHLATFDILKAKKDSIETALTSTQYSLASFKDKNQSIFRSKDMMNEQRLLLEIQKLSAMYAETEKNYQIADFTLKNKTPFIDIIDEPLLPLLANRPSIVSAIIKGILLGLVLSLGYVLGARIYRDVMA